MFSFPIAFSALWDEGIGRIVIEFVVFIYSFMIYLLTRTLGNVLYLQTNNAL